MYAQLGYDFMYRLPYDLIYEYENPDNGASWKYEDQITNPRETQHNLPLALGLNIRLNARWYFQTQFSYSIDLTKNWDQVNGKIGVNYIW